jgi:hypothetical protein
MQPPEKRAQFDALLPPIRVREADLAAIREAAVEEGEYLAVWVRRVLRAAVAARVAELTD